MDDHKKTGRDYVICGDWNIAHHEIDLKNWRGNQKNSGFLPEERAWMTKILSEMGWVDVYRALYPEHTHECYTWWSNRGQAWANNTGGALIPNRNPRHRCYRQRGMGLQRTPL